MSSESFFSISFADAVIGTTANSSNASPISINDLPILITPSPIKSGNDSPNSAIFIPIFVKISPTISGILANCSTIYGGIAAIISLTLSPNVLIFSLVFDRASPITLGRSTPNFSAISTDMGPIIFTNPSKASPRPAPNPFNSSSNSFVLVTTFSATSVTPSSAFS